MKDNYSEKILESVVVILKDLRLKRGLSHETLAAKANVTRPAISYIESGKRIPSLLLCLRIARALDVSLADVITQAEKLQKI